VPSRRSRTGERPAPEASGGFTLIEVLVALTILSISLVVLMAIFLEGLEHARENATEDRARILAQSLLAQTQAVPHPAFGETDGTSNGLHWHVQISPYGSGDDQMAWHQAAQQIDATVTWRNGDHTRSMTLSTLRLSPNGNPQ
jgi:general secretion pathway protein I